MMKISRKKQFLKMALAVSGLILIGGASLDAYAQRDPFEKSPLTKPRVYNPNPVSSGGTGAVKVAKPKPAGPPPVIVLGAPPIEQRIDYYKRLREDAAVGGLDLPKVTTVLTLDEMSVTGIFRTKRGYAAMVLAKPINLSYTIYPGEKFFDGQLVAVEENHLVFRKVTKMSNGKFTAGVENKTLRQYSIKEEVQGTAPVEKGARAETAAAAIEQQSPSVNPNSTVIIPVKTVIISPLEEMLKQPALEADKSKVAAKDKSDKKDKTAKKSKKAVKVAANKQQ